MMKPRASHRSRDRDEQGSVSIYFLIATTAVIAAVGLLVDGGEVLAARAQAVDQAEQAARAGVQQLQLDQLREGRIVPMPQRAIAVAQSYLHAAGDTGAATLKGDTLTVTARRSIPSRFLHVFGIGGFTASGTGVARLVAGIAAPGDVTRGQGAHR